MPGDGEIQLNKSFPKFCELHGWASFETELMVVLETTNAATIARNAELLKMLCRQRDKNPDRIALCTRLAERAVRSLKTFDARPPDNDWRLKSVDRAALFAGRRNSGDRRAEAAIAADRCDLTHVTERSGRPYTPVCTNTPASYDRACKTHNRDLQSLSRIAVLEQ